MHEQSCSSFIANNTVITFICLIASYKLLTELKISNTRLTMELSKYSLLNFTLHSIFPLYTEYQVASRRFLENVFKNNFLEDKVASLLIKILFLK